MNKRRMSKLFLLLMVSAVWAASARAQAPADKLAKPSSTWFLGAYQARPLPPVNFQNSSRVDSLLRGGQLYLSLSDAIALALENNLDLELKRYDAGIAQSDLMRAQGGGITRGVTLSATEAPAGIGGPSTPLLNAASTSFPFTASVPASVSDLAAVTQQQTNLSISPQTPSTAGPPIPLFDPAIVGSFSGTHQTTPQSTSFITGTNLLITRTVLQNLGYQQGFSPGTLLNVAYSTSSQLTNSFRTTFNPFTTATFGFTLTQPLLRGFGPSVNRRYIRIAKNNQRVTDMVFRQQVISTVSGVMRLYYDLISLKEDVKVKQQTVDLAKKLYSDTDAQVKTGTQPPIELSRVQAQMAAAREDLINSEAFAREQELILKNVLTRRGTAEPAIRDAHIVPTDMIPEPAPEPVRPIQDLVAEAFKNRPDIAAAALQLTNAEIALEGSRNALRPEVDLVATAQNAGLSGQVNPLASTTGTFAQIPDPFFLGGFGLALEQIARRNFPTYGVGIQLNLPLRNRVAQSDFARDQLQLRQTQIRRQQLENQVRLEVEDAVIALDRARAAYAAANETRLLQEKSLDAEQKKYAVGLSTTFLVSQYQSFLAQARSTEVAAKGAYAKARIALQRARGLTLDENSVSIDESYQGKVTRPPASLPPSP